MILRIGWSRRMLAGLGTMFLAACGGASEKGVLPADPPAGEVVALRVDPSGGRLLRAHPNALYESRDRGATWQAVPLPASVQQGRIADVAVSADGDALYVAGPGLGVLRSEDAGASWTRQSEDLPGLDVATLTAHADSAGTLYAYLPGQGIYRSEDAGAGWTKMDAGPGPEIRRFVHSDLEGSMLTGWLFAATPEGVRRSMDCFCGWRPTGELPTGSEVLDVAYDPGDPRRVYALTGGGVARSLNAGESWEVFSPDVPDVRTLTLDAGAGRLYAAGPAGIFARGVEDGSTWERIGA